MEQGSLQRRVRIIPATKQPRTAAPRRNGKQRVAAYCRVSTDKEDQLNSLATQKQFFAEYTQRTGIPWYGSMPMRGFRAQKSKNRKEFLRMMQDAERGIFDMVVVKDISRFARNTVDLLQNIRKLKALGIETQFLTANMTSMGNSEFVLTILAPGPGRRVPTPPSVSSLGKNERGKGRVPQHRLRLR